MGTKYVRVPFEVELAKKIQNKECDGRIVTRDGRSARIVCFDVQSIYPIISLVKDDNGKEKTIDCISDGRLYKDTETKNDLILEIPEYMTFKDGDVIAFGVVETFIGIFKSVGCSVDTHSNYVVLTHENNLRFDGNAWTFINSRKATESEKQKLIDALKARKEPKAKEYLKRFFGIEEKKEYEFTFKQDVLVRQNNKDLWCGAQFSHKELNHYVVFGGSYFLQCIPYNEETAHLLGTTDNTDRDKVKY